MKKIFLVALILVDMAFAKKNATSGQHYKYRSNRGFKRGLSILLRQ